MKSFRLEWRGPMNELRELRDVLRYGCWAYAALAFYHGYQRAGVVLLFLWLAACLSAHVEPPIEYTPLYIAVWAISLLIGLGLCFVVGPMVLIAFFSLPVVLGVLFVL